MHFSVVNNFQFINFKLLWVDRRNRITQTLFSSFHVHIYVYFIHLLSFTKKLVFDRGLFFVVVFFSRYILTMIYTYIYM